MYYLINLIYIYILVSYLSEKLCLVFTFYFQTVDEDSEIEKLSPLLETVVSIDTSDLHKITLIGPIQDEALLLDTVSGGGGGDDAIDRNLSMLTCENYEMADSSYCINNVVNETNASSTSGCQNVQQTNGSCGSKNASPHNRADGMSPRTADDSDYYTPEESSTSMLTSLHADKVKKLKNKVHTFIKHFNLKYSILLFLDVVVEFI